MVCVCRNSGEISLRRSQTSVWLSMALFIQPVRLHAWTGKAGDFLNICPCGTEISSSTRLGRAELSGLIIDLNTAMKFPFAANLPRIFLFSALICSVSICRGAAATSKPDILLIMPDQMRGDCLSALKHPVVRTPHLDELSRQGTLFRRGYSTCPSCIPARYSLLTGLYPSTSGVVGFKGKPIPSPTLPKMLNDAGYTTILAGRCMHQTPADESYGYQKIIRGSTYVSDDDYDAYLKHAAPESGGIRKLVATLGVSFNRWQAKPWPLAEELHPTAWAVQQARESLKTAPVDKPLFLTASFFAPHP